MPHYKLYYLNLRGRGEPIRMMFSISGIPFEDVRIEREDWPELKKTMPFDTVPVLDVDGVQIGQTAAILRYVARETGYGGPDNLTASLADALIDQFVDFVQSIETWVSVVSGLTQGDEAVLYQSCFVPGKAKHFAYFEKALEKSTTGWFANTPDLTHADVYIAACFEFFAVLVKGADRLFEGFPMMATQYRKFYAFPAIQKHVAERPDAKY